MFPYPGQTQPYQVKPTDKDLLTIAAQQGLNYPDLKALNPSITSISTGQYINVPKTFGPPAPSQPVAPSVPASFVPAMNYNGPLPKTQTQTYGPPKPPPQMPISSQASPYAFGPQGTQSNQSNSPALPYVVSHDNFLVQVSNLKNTMENATDPSQLPSTVVPSMANAAGYTPEQMLSAGYQMKNGNWVKVDTSAPGNGGGGNQPFDPQKYLVRNRQYAHNERNRYWTTLAQKQNAYKRAKHGRRTQPVNDVRADTPSTTLDVILGS